MYYALIAAMFLVLPTASVLLERIAFASSTGVLILVGKWFVFWVVGVRLLIAGLRQVIRPDYTAETIFEIRSKEALPIIRELGFSNIAIGALGLVSVLFPDWVLPAALTGGVFYGMAGIRHGFDRSKNTVQTIAMTSDLFAFVVLLAAFCLNSYTLVH